jgi:hypothetical protein
MNAPLLSLSQLYFLKIAPASWATVFIFDFQSFVKVLRLYSSSRSFCGDSPFREWLLSSYLCWAGDPIQVYCVSPLTGYGFCSLILLCLRMLEINSVSLLMEAPSGWRSHVYVLFLQEAGCNSFSNRDSNYPLKK